jgi:phosphoribosylformylglycinamidine cyclo-ligase
MTTKRSSLTYRDTGVLNNAQLGLQALLSRIAPTKAFREIGERGRQVIDVGFFASVVEIAPGLGLVLCTDGVGTKVLVAEMLRRYDTIGIDCVAMNVNDAICLGAEPISFLDYIAIEQATPEILDEIGRGLYEGARLARVAIVGGEISQVPAIVRGEEPGLGLDLVGMCAATVSLDRIINGKNVVPGDVIIGIRSSGVHCNGFTLARRALFDKAGLKPDDYVAELGCSVGAELLRPTHIYVAPVLELLRANVSVKALVNITSDGFLNLHRIAASVGFWIDKLPKPQPIFELIRRSGNIDATEMYSVFNMGIGFCVIVPNDTVNVEAARAHIAAHGFETVVIGEVVADGAKRVFLPEQHLIGSDDEFHEATGRELASVSR